STPSSPPTPSTWTTRTATRSSSLLENPNGAERNNVCEDGGERRGTYLQFSLNWIPVLGTHVRSPSDLHVCWGHRLVELLPKTAYPPNTPICPLFHREHANYLDRMAEHKLGCFIAWDHPALEWRDIT